MRRNTRLISTVLVFLVLVSSVPSSMARPLSTKSAEDDVRAALAADGWKVIWGRKINEGRYVDLAEAIRSAIAQEDPDPVLDFFTAEVEAQLAELQNQAPEIAAEAVRDLLVQAFFTGGQSIRQGRLELSADIARYERWEEVSYDEPRTYKCKVKLDPTGITDAWTWGVCSTMERVVRKVPVLPEFQPYIRYRFSGSGVPQVPVAVTRLLQDLAETDDWAAFVQDNLERFDVRAMVTLKELALSVEKQVDRALGAELKRWTAAVERLQAAKTTTERAAALRTLGESKLQEQLTRLVRIIEAAQWLDQPGSSFVLDWAQSNRANKRTEIQAGGWYVVWGVNVNELEYYKFGNALVASVVTVNPGPVLAYFGQYLQRTVEKVNRQVPDLTEAALRDLLKRAIDSRGQAIRQGNLEVTFDAATYDRWVNWTYYEPRSRACTWEFGSIKTDGFCLTAERVRRTINMPNHHQPYFRFRWADGRSFDVGQTSPVENRAYYGNTSGLYFNNETGSRLRAAVATMDPYLGELVYEGWRVIPPGETVQAIAGSSAGDTVYYYLINDDGFQWQGNMPGWVAPGKESFRLPRSQALASSSTSAAEEYQAINFVETVLKEPRTTIRPIVTLADHIGKKWDDGYAVTSLAHANGQWAVVMSQGSSYTRQSWAASTSFPRDFISKMWNEGYAITDIAYGDGTWVVVMSEGTGYTDDSWASRSEFPENVLQEQWDKGNRLSSLSFGDGQWAVVTARGRPGSQSWRTSSDFPKQAIKELWDKELYVTDLVYGGNQWAVVASDDVRYTDQTWAIRAEFPSAYITEQWDQGKHITELNYGNGQWATVASGGTGYTNQFWATGDQLCAGNCSATYAGQWTPPRREPLCTVTAGTLNLRRGPGTVYAPPIRTLAQGTQLEPLARNPEGSWIEVKVKGSADRGWVSAGSSYVNCNQDVVIAALPVGQIPPTPTPTPTPRPTPTPTAAPTPALGIGSRRVSPKDGMVMVYVPAGEFTMGASFDHPGARDSEKPEHTVYLDAYWIDQTEVTGAMYANFLAQTGYEPSSSHSWDFAVKTLPSDHPVRSMDWFGAVAYCEWAGRRLPTEAEWEKAARGTDRRQYPWGSAWVPSYLSCCGQGTAPVGSYPQGASPYGALDLAGNVSEWVQDWIAYDYYARWSPYRNPRGPDTGQAKIVRGGSYQSNQSPTTSFWRDDVHPGTRGWTIGFRCAWSE